MSHPVAGNVAFVAIKLVGYSLAAGGISEAYAYNRLHWFWIGLSRTVIGLAFGYAYYDRFFDSPNFMIGLVPIRLVEWLLLIMIFYDRKLAKPKKALVAIPLATVWSFVLDIPAAVGWFFVGGFWVC